VGEKKKRRSPTGAGGERTFGEAVPRGAGAVAAAAVGRWGGGGGGNGGGTRLLEYPQRGRRPVYGPGSRGKKGAESGGNGGEDFEL